MQKTFLIICSILAIIPVAYGKLSATKFPGTVDDISFKSRVENLSDGYKPFMDKKTYQELKIIPGEEIYTDHMIAVEEAYVEQQKIDAQSMNIYEYCGKYSDDETKCPQITAPEPTVDTQITVPESKVDRQITKAPEQCGPSQKDKTKCQEKIATEQPQKPVIKQPTISYSGYTIGGGQVIENNIVTGESCYPADHDNHFVNKILTTGKYENIHPAFEKGLITVFRKEGKCGTIKNDPCGYTCYGIGSDPKCTGIVVHSRAEAEEVYYNRYWKKYNIDKLPDVISTDIFIAGMASGPGTALSQFRRFLGLPDKKSAVDNEMINAVKNYNGDIHNDWMNLRDNFLQEVARKRYNGSVSRGYKNAIEIKRKNGCHVRPQKPLYRQ